MVMTPPSLNLPLHFFPLKQFVSFRFTDTQTELAANLHYGRATFLGWSLVILRNWIDNPFANMN